MPSTLCLAHPLHSPPCCAAWSFAAVCCPRTTPLVLVARDPGADEVSRRGFSSPSVYKSPDLQETEAYLLTVGRVLGLIVGSSPERRTRSLSKTGKAHLCPPGSSRLFFRDTWSWRRRNCAGGVGIWLQLGWRNVRGTARSGLVLKVSPGKNAAHRSWPLERDLHTEGHEEHGLGHAKAPFRHFGVHRENCHLE